MFEISTGKGKPAKPVSPSKASKEQEKQSDKEGDAKEEPVVKEGEPEPMEEETANNNNNNSFNDEDELIIKDELDNCFEEIDRIGDVEKVVRTF